MNLDSLVSISRWGRLLQKQRANLCAACIAIFIMIVSRRSTPSGTPRAMSPLPRSSSSDLSSQLSKQADEIPIVPTLKLAQRKLALKLCGSELTRSDLRKTVER